MKLKSLKVEILLLGHDEMRGGADIRRHKYFHAQQMAGTKKNVTGLWGVQLIKRSKRGEKREQWGTRWRDCKGK